MAISSVGVVGAGIIGEALIGALLRSGTSSESIKVAEKRSERKSEICQKYGVAELISVESVDVLLVAVKPQDFKSTIEEWRNVADSLPLIVSFAAGIKMSTIEKILGDKVRVIRVMPNTPMTLGRGMSAMSLGARVSKDDQEWVSRFLMTTGEAIVVPEELQDAVTATSGSGPAYFFAFTEAVVAAAMKLGLSESDAIILAKETLIGAALMVEKSGKDLKTLRENVTSPNGTTAAALKRFTELGLEEVIFESMKAARDRSIELSS
jgi:pyrroline-5-carboxylate reductase